MCAERRPTAGLHGARAAERDERLSGRPGFLDDQAYLGNAALDLYEAMGEPRYLEDALAICRAMIEHHWDKADGGFYFTADDADPLIARTKDAFDQAIPSGASMAALLCLRLGTLSDTALLSAGEGKTGREGVAVAYVCRGRTCSAPVTTVEEIERILQPAARRA